MAAVPYQLIEECLVRRVREDGRVWRVSEAHCVDFVS